MIYSFIFVMVSAISIVFVQKLSLTIPPFFSLLVTSFIALIYFNLVNINKLKAMYQACWGQKKLWLITMVTVLAMWVCAMTAPGLIGASLYAFLYFAWRGMVAFSSLSLQDWKKKRVEFCCAMLILLLIIGNLIYAMNISFSQKDLLGIGIALMGGTSAFIYFKQSQQLLKMIKLSATQILAVRFYLTILFSLPILFQPGISKNFTINNFTSLTILAFLSMIIPLYFAQKALEKISAEQHAIISSLCPVATAIVQEFTFGDVSIVQGGTYLLYSIIIGSYYLFKNNMKKMEVRALI
ncbi:MAG: EamA family transporter [Legionellales bacterium]|nr:EamA family transporter [Legionellales bacterium]